MMSSSCVWVTTTGWIGLAAAMEEEARVMMDVIVLYYLLDVTSENGVLGYVNKSGYIPSPIAGFSLILRA